MNDQITIRVFIYSAGGILLAAALNRFIVAMDPAQALSLPDPALGIPLRFAVLLTGGLELTVALICLFGKRAVLQLGWLAWIFTNYIVFRIGLFMMHCHPQATCIGSLTDPLRLSRGTIGIALQIVPAVLCFGCYALLIGLWFKRLTMPASVAMEPVETIKMFCTLCNGHIKFSSANLGQKIPCPHCHATITLMKLKNIKTSCPFCNGHIEFPLYGLGQTIACPHCAANITLELPT